jgi:FkbM family methyltransferase
MYGAYRALSYCIIEVKLRVYNQGILKSYSQEKEDLVIDRILGKKRDGFYVDVGASDPVRFNNTNRFYSRGWHGINIEPDVRKWQRLMSKRPRDLNLNIGVAESSGILDYYKMYPDNLSTFSAEERSIAESHGFLCEEVVPVPVKSLALVLEEAQVKDIDFMSVDTEGLDMIVLKSNDWDRFRPQVICVESAPIGVKFESSGQKAYLAERGYRLEHQNKTNQIFISEQQQSTMRNRSS